jgi:hypothetical protein
VLSAGERANQNKLSLIHAESPACPNRFQCELVRRFGVGFGSHAVDFSACEAFKREDRGHVVVERYSGEKLHGTVCPIESETRQRIAVTGVVGPS